MAIVPIYYGFRVNDPGAIDSRFTYASATLRKAIPVTVAYEGLITYQTDTNEVYALIDATDPTDDDSWQKVGNVASWAENGNTDTIPSTKIPHINFTDVQTYETVALRNAATDITWHKGDVAIITGDNADVGLYFYTGADQVSAGTTESTDYTRLNIAGTNLTQTVNGTTYTLHSSTGDDVILSEATTTTPGIMGSVDKVVLENTFIYPTAEVTIYKGQTVVTGKQGEFWNFHGADSTFVDATGYSLSEGATKLAFSSAPTLFSQITDPRARFVRVAVADTTYKIPDGFVAVLDYDKMYINISGSEVDVTTTHDFGEDGLDNSTWTRIAGDDFQLPAQDSNTNLHVLRSTGTAGSEEWSELFPTQTTGDGGTNGQLLQSTGVLGSEVWVDGYSLPTQATTGDDITTNLYLQSTGVEGSEVWKDLDTFPKVNYVNDRSSDSSLATVNVPNDEIAYITASRWFLNVSGAQIDNVVVGDDDDTLNTKFNNDSWIQLGIGSGYPDQAVDNDDPDVDTRNKVLTSNGVEGQESWRGVLANAIHDPSTFTEAEAIPAGDVVYVGPGQWYKNISGEEADGVDINYTLYNDATQWQQLGSSAYYTIISATDQTVYPGGLVYVDADNSYQNISGTVILNVNNAEDDDATDFAEVDSESNPLWLQVNSNVDTIFTLPTQSSDTNGSYLRSTGVADANPQWARVFHDAADLDPDDDTVTLGVAPNEVLIVNKNLWYLQNRTTNVVETVNYEYVFDADGNPIELDDDILPWTKINESDGILDLPNSDANAGVYKNYVRRVTGNADNIDRYSWEEATGGIDEWSAGVYRQNDVVWSGKVIYVWSSTDDATATDVPGVESNWVVIASDENPHPVYDATVAYGYLEVVLFSDGGVWGAYVWTDSLIPHTAGVSPLTDGNSWQNLSVEDTDTHGIDGWVSTVTYNTDDVIWNFEDPDYKIYIWSGTGDSATSLNISPTSTDATNLWVLISAAGQGGGLSLYNNTDTYTYLDVVLFEVDDEFGIYTWTDSENDSTAGDDPTDNATDWQRLGGGSGSGNGIVKYVSADTYPTASVIWVDDADDKIYTWIGTDDATSTEVPGTDANWVELSKSATADFTVKSLLVAADDIAVNQNDVVYLSSTRWYQYTGETAITSLTLANIDTTIAADATLWTRFASPAALEVNVLTTDAVTIADGQIAYLNSVAWYQNISGVDQTDIDSDYTTWDAVDTEDNPIWLQLGDVGRILLKQNGGDVVGDGASTIDFIGGDAIIVEDGDEDGLQLVTVNAIPSTQREEVRFHFTEDSSYTNVYGVDGDNILRVGFPGDSDLEEDTTFRTTLTISDVETVFDATVTVTDDDNPTAGDETITAIGEAMIADTDWVWNGIIQNYDNTTISAIPADATWDNYWRDQTDREIIFMTWQQQGLGQFTIDLEQDSTDILDADQRVWRIQLFDSDTDEGGSIVFRQGYTSNSQYFYGSLGTDTDDFVAFTEWFGTDYDPQFGDDYNTAVSQVIFLNADDYTPPGLESIDATNMATIAFCLTGDPDGPTKLSEGMGVRDMTLETGGGNGDFRVHFTSHLSGVRYQTGASSVTEPIGFGSDAKTFQYETSRLGTNWSTLGRRNSKFIDIDLSSDAIISIDEWRIVNSPATNDSLGGGTYEKATPTPVKVQTRISITGQDGEVVDGWPKLYHTLDKVNDPNIDDVISEIVTAWQTDGYTIERIAGTNSINILRVTEGFEDSRGWSISIDNNPDNDTLPAALTGNIALDDDFMAEGPDPDNENEYIDVDGKDVVFNGYDNYVRANPDNDLPFGADLSSIQIFGINHKVANGYTQVNDVDQRSTLRFDDNFSVTDDSTNEETNVSLADTIIGERTIELEGYVHAADAIPADPDAIPPQEAVDAVTEVIGDQFIIDSTTEDGTETFTVATVDRHGVELFEQTETSFGNTKVTFNEVNSFNVATEGGHLSTVDLKLYSQAGGSDSDDLPRMNLEVNNLSSDSDWAGSGEITFDRRFPLTAAGAHTGIYAESKDGMESRLRFTNSLANSEDTAFAMEHDRVISFHDFETQDGVKFTNLTGTGDRLAIATDGTVTRTSGDLTVTKTDPKLSLVSDETYVAGNEVGRIDFEGENSDDPYASITVDNNSLITIGSSTNTTLVPGLAQFNGNTEHYDSDTNNPEKGYNASSIGFASLESTDDDETDYYVGGSIHSYINDRDTNLTELHFYTDDGGSLDDLKFSIGSSTSKFGERTAEIGSTAQARAAHKLDTDLFTLGDFHRISTFDLEDTIYKDNVSGDIAEKSVIYEVTAQGSFMDDADTPVNAETVAPLSHTRMEYESDDTDAFGTYIVGPYKQPRDESIGERWDTLKVSPGKTEFFGDQNDDTDGTVIATIENGAIAIETYAEITSGSIGTSATTTVGTDTTARTYITYTYVGTDYYRVFRHADDTDTTFEGDEQIWDSIDNDDHRVVAIKNY